MRGVFALPLAAVVLGVPAGLAVWLNGPSTSDHGTASRTQYVKMIANENVPSDPLAEKPQKNINSSEASGQRADAVHERRPAGVAGAFTAQQMFGGHGYIVALISNRPVPDLASARPKNSGVCRQIRASTDPVQT